MPSIVLRLRPEDLVNPDADLRYLIPSYLETATDGAVRDDGYDYEDDDEMVIFLATDHAQGALELVRTALTARPVLGNELAGQVRVGVMAQGDVRSVRNGRLHFGSVTLELHRPGTGRVRAQTRGQGFVGQGSPESVPATGYEDWRCAALDGSAEALHSIGLERVADVVVTEIVGMSSDTTAEVVALAAARALWLAAGREPEAARIRSLEHSALGDAPAEG